LKLKTNGFGFKTHQQLLYELVQSFTVDNLVICTQKLDWLPKWGKLHHELVVCQTRNEHSTTEPKKYLSLEKDTEGFVVQISTKEDDVKLFKWRQDDSLTIKEERPDFFEKTTLSAGNIQLKEIIYILIQEMDNPSIYELEIANILSVLLSPRFLHDENPSNGFKTSTFGKATLIKEN